MVRRRWLAATVVLMSIVLPGCGSDDPLPAAVTTAPAPPEVASPGAPGQTVVMPLGDRPFRLHIPTSYRADQPAALLVVLHGYQGSGAIQEEYFKLTAQSDRRGFLYAMPDGTKNSRGGRFWNATDACCNFFNSTVDDSSYLVDLIATVAKSYQVDRSRVFLVGHSNGGFMAYRMACEHADVITAIVALAGVMDNDMSRCEPARPVSVLHIHGTADDTIAFGGGRNVGQPYPSAEATVDFWRKADGCRSQPDTSQLPWDLSLDVDGAETTITAYAKGCRDGARVQLWTMRNGPHTPALTKDFAPAIVDFLYQLG